jgi:hypothetical protein
MLWMIQLISIVLYKETYIYFLSKDYDKIKWKVKVVLFQNDARDLIYDPEINIC